MYGFFIDYFLGNIPTWVWPFVAGGGMAVYFLAGFLSNLPQFKPYTLFIKPVAFITFTVGVFMYGGAGVVDLYQARIKEAEQKLAIADQKSTAATAALNANIKERRDDIRQNRDAGRDRIAANAQQLDKECTVSTDAIGIHNDAAQNKKPSVTVTLDGKVTAK
jgi:hypothetical protein